MLGLGLGFRVNNATAPLQLFLFSLSFSDPQIGSIVAVLSWELTSYLLFCPSWYVSRLSLVTCYIWYYFSNSCFPFDDREVFFPVFRVFLFTITRPWLVLCACVPCMPLFFFVTEAGFFFLQNVFSLSISLYPIPLHSATTTPVPICGRA